MGEVFLAYSGSDAARARPLVLKRLHSHYASNSDLTRMFMHEIALLGVFDHPAIPRLVDHAPNEYLVTEFVTGADAAQLIEHVEPVPVPHACVTVAQLLDVLEHVHTKVDANGRPLNIIHRDICLGNMRLRPDGTTALLDFGVASSALFDDAGAQARGTPGYVAPEAVTGSHPVTSRSDLFAAGVVLHELLTGRRLFPGGPLVAMTAVAEAEIPPPQSIRNDIPEAMGQLVMQALSRDPAQRPASAAAMSTALQSASGVPVSAASRAALGAWWPPRVAPRG